MLSAYTDGACRISNPGLCSCAWVLDLPGGRVSQGYYLGPEFHSNNFAEYMGLVNLLTHLYEKNYTGVKIFCDSALVVNQVNQEWIINDVNLRKMAAQCYGLLTARRHTLEHVKGHATCEGNAAADLLCNKVLDEHMEEYYAQSKNLLDRPTA